MSQTATPFATVGVVGDTGRSSFVQALRGSGREVVELDAAAQRGGEVELLVVPVAGGAEPPMDVITSAAEAAGTSVPVLVEAETLSATEVAARLPEPGRVLVVHHFDTGPGREVVEVVPALQTDDAVLQQVVSLVDSLDGLAPVVAKDRPGYLLNSLFLPYLNDVVRELDDGLATAADIDVALQLGLGYRVGPFELLDTMGLERHLSTTTAVYEATGDARFAPPPLLSRLVTAGCVGGGSALGGFQNSTPTD